ncbi:MAG: vWA domain-containing protein [Hyphomicrobiaceae bacterium]
MLINLFYALRAADVPVTLREHLTLLDAMRHGLTGRSVQDFYYLSRTCLVKDERHLDKFDRVFAQVFQGVEPATDYVGEELPEEWLRAVSELYLSDEEKQAVANLGGWDKIMEELRKRLAEQSSRHQGGSKWIGTAGTSPYGAYGYNPAGVRIGQNMNRHNRALKVWDRREYKDLDDTVEIGTRNIKLALRRLRKFAREGVENELDLPATIQGTAHNGYLDIKMRPERRNAAKVIMFFDVGGSMDWHIRAAEDLFSASRAEFKHLKYYYFHNCLYEFVWQNNARRWTERFSTWDILHTYPSDYKVIFVGDASMSPYELTLPGGSVEHMNAEAGNVWLNRVTEIYNNCVWLNPVHENHWKWTPSIQMVRDQLGARMYPLTLNGLDTAMRELMR